MHGVTLSPDGRSRLASQVTQNGIFTHALHDPATGAVRATATIAIEQCCHDVSLRVDLGESRNSITLPKREDTGERVALFLENLANGEADEDRAYDRLFMNSIEGFRRSKFDIDDALKAERWADVCRAQESRSLHAHTIAMIVDRFAAIVPEQGGRS